MSRSLVAFECVNECFHLPSKGGVLVLAGDKSESIVYVILCCKLFLFGQEYFL